MMINSPLPQEDQLQQPRDARSLARMLINHFNEGAECYAVHQALKALARNDIREAARWRWIAEITRETLRGYPV